MGAYEEREYLYWLCHISNLGAVTINKLIKHFGSYKEIYNIEGSHLEEMGFIKEELAARFNDFKTKLDFCRKELIGLERRGIRFLTPTDKQYPQRLLHIHGYPMGLFVKGELPLEEIPTAAIIGARNCTNYGKQMAEYMAKELSGAGVQIISGLAYGIDGAGHAGALNGGYKTYGVLGCGINICYPKENYMLYERMTGQGGIVSECVPDEQPQPKNFPMRNRIISGLSDVVLVIEARKKSGSLITASLGLEQGKEIFALPGSVNDPLSEGCNQLIRDGAGVLLEPEDVLGYFSLQSGKILTVHEKLKNGLAKREKMVYSCLDLQPKCMEEIVKESGLSVSECFDILLDLELRGYIVQTSHQYYRKRL